MKKMKTLIATLLSAAVLFVSACSGPEISESLTTEAALHDKPSLARLTDTNAIQFDMDTTTDIVTTKLAYVVKSISEVDYYEGIPCIKLTVGLRDLITIATEDYGLTMPEYTAPDSSLSDKEKKEYNESFQEAFKDYEYRYDAIKKKLTTNSYYFLAEVQVFSTIPGFWCADPYDYENNTYVNARPLVFVPESMEDIPEDLPLEKLFSIKAKVVDPNDTTR